MHDNIFAPYKITVPIKYRDNIKKYCRTGTKIAADYAPFARQVDFWYFSFVLAVKLKLAPDHDKETSEATDASILTPYQVTHIQLAALAHFKKLEHIADSKLVFNYATAMAFAGMPKLLQILDDSDSGEPLWALLGEIESMLS